VRNLLSPGSATSPEGHDARVERTLLSVAFDFDFDSASPHFTLHEPGRARRSVVPQASQGNNRLQPLRRKIPLGAPSHSPRVRRSHSEAIIDNYKKTSKI